MVNGITHFYSHTPHIYVILTINLSQNKYIDDNYLKSNKCDIADWCSSLKTDKKNNIKYIPPT